MSASQTQVGGDHYAKMKIQPIHYITENGLGFIEGNVIKYISRWDKKNGIEDLKKARHYIDLLIESEDKKKKKEQERKTIPPGAPEVKYNNRVCDPDHDYNPAG
jgi:Protein of unknwon function (DUF3310)